MICHFSILTAGSLNILFSFIKGDLCRLAPQTGAQVLE